MISRRFLSIAAVALVASGSTLPAQTWSTLIPAASFTAVTAQATAQPEDIAVDSTGRIFVADEVGGGERIVRFNADGTNGVLFATDANIIAAIELVNGTATQSDITIRDMAFDTDGDLIVVSDGADPELAALVSIAPGGAITVISCAVDANPSPVEGAGTVAVIGTTAYISINGAFIAIAGPDAIVSVGTNAAGPAAAVTTVSTEAQINTGFGIVTAGAASIGPMIAYSATQLLAIDSNSGGTSDNIALVNVTTGVATSLKTRTQIQTDLSIADDLGFTGVALAPSGDILLANSFGAAATDDSIITLAAVTFTATIKTEATLQTELAVGTDSTGAYGRMAYQASNTRILVAGQGTTAIRGIYALTVSSSVNDWMMY